MIINSIGINSKVVLELSADEVNILNNVMFQCSKEERSPMFWELYAGIMIARDISQYGHLDSLSIEFQLLRTQLLSSRRRIKNEQ